MYTIGQIARRFSISRSTLLYYDSIGLLSPRSRSEGNYRLYSEDDVSRMARIALFREAGLPLEDIANILKSKDGAADLELEKQLGRINKEIQSLRHQQRVIVRLLGDARATGRSRALSKANWVSLLRATGLSERDMQRWHAEFEKMSPEGHQDFLESLGIQEREIASIRGRATF